VETLGGPPEMQFFRDREKRVQVTEFHDPSRDYVSESPK
jgi:hypothetical protein